MLDPMVIQNPKDPLVVRHKRPMLPVQRLVLLLQCSKALLQRQDTWVLMRSSELGSDLSDLSAHRRLESETTVPLR